MKPTIKHVFFDLDRTLWDFNANSREELAHLWKTYHLHQKGISLPEEFIKIYEKVNEECWALYRKNEITKEALRGKRFKDTLAYFGIQETGLDEKIGASYIQNSPQRTILVEGTIDLLSYLKEKYTLHIITNGFNEVQHLKLENCQLTPFFNEVITSDEVGVMKPNPRVFEYSLQKAQANNNESVYIGDSLKIDIEGALNVGMHAIFYNPTQKEHSLNILGDVTQLKDIKNIL
ncbi:MAG: YjjG family noncanonical pyrimidine nucleotidase [Flavobacteriales bacterium]|jgi:putative hydrolase of the HAD superfamily|nr:YjjG family noncanonical pyrimidine nucleotidase [Flavobacteriales bacterium]